MTKDAQNQRMPKIKLPNGDKVGFSADALSTLQSAQQLEILNAMDQLRTYGVSEYVSLPQLVVCGDQSAGKSSVLEAITEVPFPQNQGTCTRFATQIVLRRSVVTEAIVTIIPESRRTDNEVAKFAQFKKKIEDLKDLPSIITEAEALILFSNNVRTKFSKDVLNVEISGPKQPHLTVVDLPGIIHTSSSTTEDEEGDEFEVEVVKELVKGYMKEDRTIILAIVAGNYDYNNQIILQMAKELDQDRTRTLGIVTKPDLQEVGSDYEKTLVKMVKNEVKHLSLGWHVLKNRGFKERECSIEQRNIAEEKFFNQGVWTSLPRKDVGVESLRIKLSNLLYQHIKRELPKVVQDISAALKDCDDTLATLGPSRATTGQQHTFLFKLSSQFHKIASDGSDGYYQDKFFHDVEETVAEKYAKRLRAKVTRLCAAFARIMHDKGHVMTIEWPSDDGSKPAAATAAPGKTQKSNKRGINSNRNTFRTKKPSSTFNPLIIGHVFWHQSRKWAILAQEFLDNINRACKKYVQTIVHHIAGEEVAEAVLGNWIRGILDKRYVEAKQEFAKIMASLKAQPITYNHEFTTEVQRSRQGNDTEACKEVIRKASGCDSYDKIPADHKFDKDTLLRELSRHYSIENMDEYACREVLEYMRAFYKVALKKFIDNMATDVIERHLLEGLEDIFSPVAVNEMTDDQIKRIAEESESTSSIREYTQNKRDGLQKGLDICRAARPGVDYMGGEGEVEELEDNFSFGREEQDIPAGPPSDEKCAAHDPESKSGELTDDPNIDGTTDADL
ncbi:P-loop containing nucleoside triphosphate hydrolase protein [Phlyctochytrium arcticum]|nr:P-loop containing nucleoside triphosphate hydrolase protein [Phlyctochytrium arcticum]